MEGPDTPTAEEIAQHISAMGDSVTVINEAILKPFTEQVHRRVKANVDHLGIMLAKDFIIADTGSKTAFTTAIDDGNAYIGSPQKILCTPRTTKLRLAIIWANAQIYNRHMYLTCRQLLSD